MESDRPNKFKLIFKYFKQISLTDLNELVNLKSIPLITGEVQEFQSIGSSFEIFGLSNPSTWTAYTVETHPGIIFVRNPFTSIGQRYWIARCLRDYPRKPNRRNVDIDTSLKDVDNLWEYSSRDGWSSLNKLRWATLGYHHNWNTKVYSEEDRSAFPDDLALLSKYVAAALGFEEYNAQAAIINMYHQGSCLSGHVDNSECDVQAPLLSFSFGQSAIFLIGGTSLDAPILPLLLQSGDILLMGREARLCYHAVPRILPAASCPWDCVSESIIEQGVGFDEDLIANVQDSNFWRDFADYVAKSRINMNVRQVLKTRQTCLEEV